MIVPEPCGYAVLLLIANIQKTVSCGRIKNCMLQLVCLLTSLRLLVRYLPRQQQGERGGRRRGKEGREREKREGSGIDRLNSTI